jgi:hypothetical protein
MPEIACPKCRALLNAPDRAVGCVVMCGQCRHTFTATGAGGRAHTTADASAGPAAPPVAAPPLPQEQAYPGSAAGRPQTKPPAGIATASMVLGIVCLVFSFFSLGCMCSAIVAWPCSILAVVLASAARRRIRDGTGGGDGLAKAGLVCGLVGLVLNTLGVILILAVWAGNL